MAKTVKNRVLVIDDELEFVDFVAERLRLKGFGVSSALSGKEGLEKAHSEKPDLIILDLAMPGMSGYDVCLKLKTDEHYKRIPVIIISAKFQPNDIEFGKSLGAEAYFTKPVELEGLFSEISSLLKNRTPNRLPA
jgi:DNA-binding response OmpR family regulator